MGGYPDYMQGSLGLVEKTRPSRIGKTFPSMTADEKEEILREWHPDYKKEAKRPLGIGPNRGDIMPHEVAAIFEAHPLIARDMIDLTDVDYDVDILIIGGGGAGLSASITALESGVERDKILLVQKLRLGDSNPTTSGDVSQT